MKEFTTQCPSCSEKIVCSDPATPTVSCSACGKEFIPTEKAEKTAVQSCSCCCCSSPVDDIFAAIKNTVFPPDEANFSIPILSRIFYVFGFIALAAIPVVLIYALLQAIEDNGNFAIFLALSTFVLILKALIYWGIAQFIYYTAKTSSNTNKMLALMKEKSGK